MAAEERWYFTKEQLNNSPSRRCGIDAEKELSYRQQGANLIQDMGQRLQVNQLAINTAIVYMHRFYMFHPFTRFHRHAIAPAALFLAAKVEEQPRKLEHVIKVAYHCLFRDQPALDTQSEGYLERAQELVVNENILLQTLGFDVAIDHPHTHVVKCCQLVRATKDLAQTSYFMATSSLHMTTMCLQYKPTVVACVCIYIVCTWSHYEIQRVTEGRDWFWYVDKTVTLELLESLTAEFLTILDKCPSRLKKIMNSSQHTDERGGRGSQSAGSGSSSVATPSSRSSSSSATTLPNNASGQPSALSSRTHDHNSHNKTALKVPTAQTHQHQQPSKLNLKEYNEKREKERREREKIRERDMVDPRESKQFALVSTSHTSQSVSSAVASIASSHAAVHSGLPIRSKSSKSSSGRGGSSHPDHLKGSVHSNHKTHSHSASQVARDAQQPSLESLRGSEPTQRRDISARSDSERYDKSGRTSSSVVEGRLQGEGNKPLASDIRQQLLDVKPSRQSLDAVLVKREKEIKVEPKSVVERKPPEQPIKLESVRPKVEVKSEPKEETKSLYNTIFNNSELPEFALSDFMNDNTFLNLSDGPPDQLFDNSDTETKPDISAIIEDDSLLSDPTPAPASQPPPTQPKEHVQRKSPLLPTTQQQPQTQHQHHSSTSITTTTTTSASNFDASGSVSAGVGETRLSENAILMSGAGANHHSSRHHYNNTATPSTTVTATTNGSVTTQQSTHTTPQASKSSSKRAAREREAEKKGSSSSSISCSGGGGGGGSGSGDKASTEAELVPMVTKLEDTRYRTALSDPATPIKVRPDAAASAAIGTTTPAASSHTPTKPPAMALFTTPATAPHEPPTQKVQPPPPSKPQPQPQPQPSLEPVLRVKLPQPERSSKEATQPPQQQQQLPSQAQQPPPTHPHPQGEAVMVGGGGGLVPSDHRKHKNEHHHKHKEKKKHRHKEKEKHKDKEHKDHKDRKEKKKHKKHKDKDKDKSGKTSAAATPSAGGEGGAAPIKITIPKDKIMYTPKPSIHPLRTHAASAPPTAPVSITSLTTTTIPTALATPGIPKFKIDKSKLNRKDLFGTTSSTSSESSPSAGVGGGENQNRDTPTTSLKIKISRDRLRPDSKESKKRDRGHSPGGDALPSKVQRLSNTPNAAPPQVPIKDLDPSRWNSQRQ